ncbi:hypothetical protein ACEQPO_12715 [Bacillus sp. SL00103]
MAVSFFKRILGRNIFNSRKASRSRKLVNLKKSVTLITKFMNMRKTMRNAKEWGTTIVCALVHMQTVTIAHIGDSRRYLLREGALTQLTDDHSLVNELVKTGEISKADAEYHPRKNVLTKALGTDKRVQIDARTLKWTQEIKSCFAQMVYRIK